MCFMIFQDLAVRWSRLVLKELFLELLSLPNKWLNMETLSCSKDG